jgi:hypothetical protein
MVIALAIWSLTAPAESSGLRFAFPRRADWCDYSL